MRLTKTICVLFVLIPMRIDADELVLNDDNIIEWKLLADKGETYEVTTLAGKKLTIKKADVKEIRARKVNAPLTGGVFEVRKDGQRVPAIDLMKVIDPKRDALAGSLKLDGSTLEIIHTGGFNQVHIPYVPPDEYDVRIIAERKGTITLHIGLVVGKRQFEVVLGGKDGVYTVDGESTETSFPTYAWTDGKPSTIICAVRKTRLIIMADGKNLLDWKADYGRLNLSSSWQIPKKDTLFLGAWSTFKIHKIEVVPVSGGMGRLGR